MHGENGQWLISGSVYTSSKQHFKKDGGLMLVIMFMLTVAHSHLA